MRRITGQEHRILWNDFEMRGFVAQEGQRNVAREKKHCKTEAHCQRKKETLSEGRCGRRCEKKKEGRKGDQKKR